MTNILDIIEGDKIEFINEHPIRHTAINPIFSERERKLIHNKINDLLQKGIIKETTHEEVEFVSPIFIKQKPDGDVRLILNLIDLNNYINKIHFKMETIQTVLANITKGCYMSVLDLKDAYFSIKIAEEYQCFLKFKWDKVLYAFVCYPNGLGPCPRKFTKINKAPLCDLRASHHIVSGYIDDFFMQGQTYLQCERTVIKTALTFDDLGYVIHPTKSKFIPKQIATYLGFIINTIRMIVTLTDEKKTDLKEKLENLLERETLAIREVASVVGHMVASFPASAFGPLYYRNIERDKIIALKISNGDFDKHMRLSKQVRSDIYWWLENIDTMFAPIHLPPITSTIYTDSSDIGWGVVFENKRTGGPWKEVEVTSLHINIREMLAVYFATRSFREMFRGKHIKVHSDNSTTVQVINKMGSTHSIV